MRVYISSRLGGGVTSFITLRHMVALAAGMSALVLVTPRAAGAQTLLAQEAYHERFCGGWSIFRDCQTVATRRIARNFTQQYLGAEVFGSLWGAAAHCLTVSYPNERCAQSVAIFSDPTWGRVVWGQPGSFLKYYGAAGEGTGEFLQPAGVAITRADGEWHVAFVADAVVGRIAVLALGYSCRCVRWLGTITAAETGIPLKGPFDVAWDPAGTWTMDDDRVFILDTGNNRVVVYRVGLYPTASTMSQQFVSAFGTRGTGTLQFMGPQGIDIRTYSCAGRICADVYIADTDNRRVVHYWYDTDNSSTPPPGIWLKGETPPDPNAEFIGISHDHYGDIFVADRAQNRVLKLRGSVSGNDLDELKRYGGSTSSWQNGNFLSPTSLEITRAFRSSGTAIVEEGLPFVNSLERWADTTGIQTHRLGVDVENLTGEVSAEGGNIYGRFLFTATGLYSWTIRTPSGAPVASSGGNVSSRSGWVYPSANVSGYGTGMYSLTVQYQSGYMYDDGQWKTKTSYLWVEQNTDPCAVNPTAPGCGCPGPEIDCPDPYSVPIDFSLAQAAPLPAATVSLDASRTGLRRIQKTDMPRLRGGGGGSISPTVKDVWVNGIAGIQFGVPRPTPAASAIDGDRATTAMRGEASRDQASVQIRIYDTGGRLVRTAVNENLNPGYYQYQWDGLDNRGQRVAPGVYVAVMTAPGFSKTSKLIITR